MKIILPAHQTLWDSPRLSGTLPALLLWVVLSNLPTLQSAQVPSYSSKITFCNTDRNCTEAALTNCLAGGCVNLKNLTVNEIAFQVGKPNNIYFIFSLWDGACHPVVWNTGSLGPLLTLYENGSPQSETESFNGLLPAPQVCFPAYLQFNFCITIEW